MRKSWLTTAVGTGGTDTGMGTAVGTVAAATIPSAVTVPRIMIGMVSAEHDYAKRISARKCYTM